MWLRAAGANSAGFPGRQRVEASDGGKMKWAGAGWAGGRVRIDSETSGRSRTPRTERRKMLKRRR